MSLGNMVLYESEFQRVQAILAKLQKEIRADLVLLISRSGQPIVDAGPVKDIDLTALASLAAANLAATDGLAQLIGEREFSVLFHQGNQRSLHISDLMKQYSLVLMFDGSASIGFVRWKIKRATTLLEDVFRDFKQRTEKSKSAVNLQDQGLPQQFSDEELEELLGRSF
jgi:predicted regulator of Ras-like GTPase activity (Roadblock/LC7/MglB family)